MERHIIQGQGQHRRQYLSERWTAKTGDYRTWVRKAEATRFDAAQAERIARAVGGKVVKLMAPVRVQEQVEVLREFIAEHATRAPARLTCHWVHGATEFEGADITESENFCHDCGMAKVEELRKRSPKEAERVRLALDGGYGTEQDSIPFCETCGAKLAATLTEYGEDEELKHFAAHPPAWNSPDEWDDVQHATSGMEKDDPRWAQVARWVARARRQEAAARAREEKRAKQPELRQVRAQVLSLLVARAEQKRGEPSFRLWKELARWCALPFAAREEPTKEVSALEKRLLEEAAAFFHLLGYHWNGGEYVKTPYGTHWWPTVVGVEQHRLWGTPAFLEGQAAVTAGIHECPYPEQSAEAEAWRMGHLSVRT